MKVHSIDPTFRNLYGHHTTGKPNSLQILEGFCRDLVYSSRRPVRADKLINPVAPQQRLSTNFSELDDILHGGLLRGSITEFAGPTNTGKTIVRVSFELI